MTTKEHAKELVEKFTLANGNSFFSKECALICVGEIIFNGFNPHAPFNYWQEVKQEIRKL